MSEPVRVLLIGLDGATFTILDPLMAAGLLPRLRELMNRGVRAVLRSTIHPLTPPAWTSLVTGRTPGNHGCFDFFRPDETDSRLPAFATARDVRCETLWAIVNRYGMPVTSLNFPIMSPPRPLHGTLIPGWVPWRHLRLLSRPAGLFDRLKAIPGFHPRKLSFDVYDEVLVLEGMPADQAVGWIGMHVERERTWSSVAQYLIRETADPLVGVLFDGMDKIQHLAYRLLDDELPVNDRLDHDEQVRLEALAYYHELDGAIGRLLDAAGPETLVFVTSDHGAGAWTHLFYLNSWLERHGYLRWVDSGQQNGADKPDARRDFEIRQHYRTADLIDWEQTVAYGTSTSSNGIRIRRPGDPGGGGVAPNDYLTVRQRLQAELLGATDPATGERVVAQVLTREQAYPGQAMEQAPDLVVILRDYGFVSLRPSEVVVARRPSIMGTHRPEGLFLAAGPGLNEGLSIGELSIVDVAPTILHCLGLPIPVDLEGQLPSEIFDQEWLAAHPLQIGPPTVPQTAFAQPSVAASMSADEETAVIGRLRSLGYLE
jgi:predicted AlkP superfamily phosphohydrolase/phosphomutase